MITYEDREDFLDRIRAMDRFSPEYRAALVKRAIHPLSRIPVIVEVIGCTPDEAGEIAAYADEHGVSDYLASQVWREHHPD